MTNILKTLIRGIADALLPKKAPKPAPNVYSWHLCRRKGRSVAMINRNGKKWCELTLLCRGSHQAVRDYINQHDNNWIER